MVEFLASRLKDCLGTYFSEHDGILVMACTCDASFYVQMVSNDSRLVKIIHWKVTILSCSSDRVGQDVQKLYFFKTSPQCCVECVNLL